MDRLVTGTRKHRKKQQQQNIWRQRSKQRLNDKTKHTHTCLNRFSRMFRKLNLIDGSDIFLEIA